MQNAHIMMDVDIFVVEDDICVKDKDKFIEDWEWPPNRISIYQNVFHLKMHSGRYLYLMHF